jgi:phytoene dehydrogenase-like protein
VSKRRDAIVVGSGPNGLAAAITLAEAGWNVRVLERSSTPGGGCRTAALTLPGYLHDVCSAVHPLAVGSPFFQRTPLQGIDWVQPPLPFAHALTPTDAVALHRSVEETAEMMGPDAQRYRRFAQPLADKFASWTPTLLERSFMPRHPALLARFGMNGVRSARGFAHVFFKGERGRALFAGVAAHVIGSLGAPMTASMGLMMMLTGHALGWPFPRGGAERIVDALMERLRGLGGVLEVDTEVRSIDSLPKQTVIVFDLTPRQLLRIAGNALSPSYRQALSRFRHGPGVFKIDYALSAPIPWKAEACRRAGTVHVGGTFEDVDGREEQTARGVMPEHPFLLVAQHTVFDSSRAPPGGHTAWVYCHVPHGSEEDMTERIERELERYAPGFRDCVLARHTMSPAVLERYNPNYIGGDIAAGSHAGFQLLLRPVPRWNPYRTSHPLLYLCSASTPPGAGVHGMCGQNAAHTVVRDHRDGV